ncbi:hypothetical protein SAMN04488483_1229 [Pseudomonas helmanticensis]|uniref:Uncharacterized protein n=1 Tax=Pseudomonas helmanticensis TaxID=1471381 RepID=A0ACD2U2D3_9PSED|nr:hypothetical protein SAMN04488483_1229 [Pseudomonas helmanticensis]
MTKSDAAKAWSEAQKNAQSIFAIVETGLLPDQARLQFATLKDGAFLTPSRGCALSISHQTCAFQLNICCCATCSKSLPSCVSR